MERDIPFFIHKWVHHPSDKGLRFLHCRDFWKIVYVVSGSGELNINGRNHKIEPASVLFIHPNDITNYCVNSPKLILYNACFMPKFFVGEEQYFDHKHQFFSIFSPDFKMSHDLADIFYLHDSGQSLHHLFRSLLAEYRGNNVNRKSLIKAMMIELLIRLQRLGLKHFVDNKRANIVLMVRDYIARNRGNINYPELCKLVGLSQSRLCTVFKAATGHCISFELLEQRLHEAEKLLSTTSIKVSEICFQCGFNDLSYFHRKFKEKFGLTPRQLRLRLWKEYY